MHPYESTAQARCSAPAGLPEPGLSRSRVLNICCKTTLATGTSGTGWRQKGTGRFIFTNILQIFPCLPPLPADLALPRAALPGSCSRGAFCSPSRVFPSVGFALQGAEHQGRVLGAFPHPTSCCAPGRAGVYSKKYVPEKALPLNHLKCFCRDTCYTLFCLQAAKRGWLGSL